MGTNRSRSQRTTSPRIAGPPSTANSTESEKAEGKNPGARDGGTRVIADSTRAIARSTRVIAGSARAIAESTQTIAGSARAIAESTRAKAESTRMIVGNAREIAESRQRRKDGTLSQGKSCSVALVKKIRKEQLRSSRQPGSIRQHLPRTTSRRQSAKQCRGGRDSNMDNANNSQRE